MNENGQMIFEVFWQEERELCIASWARWEAQRKGLVDLGRSVKTNREIQMLNQRHEIFQNAIEGKLRVQDRERVKKCWIKLFQKYRIDTQKDTRSLTDSGERA